MTREQIRQQVYDHLDKASRLSGTGYNINDTHARAHAASVHVDIARVYAGLLS